MYHVMLPGIIEPLSSHCYCDTADDVASVAGTDTTVIVLACTDRGCYRSGSYGSDVTHTLVPFYADLVFACSCGWAGFRAQVTRHMCRASRSHRAFDHALTEDPDHGRIECGCGEGFTTTAGATTHARAVGLCGHCWGAGATVANDAATDCPVCASAGTADAAYAVTVVTTTLHRTATDSSRA